MAVVTRDVEVDDEDEGQTKKPRTKKDQPVDSDQPVESDEATEDNDASRDGETSNGGERFPKKMTCDLCGFEGTAQQVGSHVRLTHQKEIQEKVMEAIQEGGRRGVSRRDIRETTGWTGNRISGVLRRLQDQGLIREDDDSRNLRISRRPGRPRKDDSTTTIAPARRGGRAVTMPSSDVSGLLANLQSSNARNTKQAMARAQERLINDHEDEYVRYFVQELLTLQMGSFDAAKLERVAQALVS